MKVIAKQLGYYAGLRRYEGQVFELEKKEDLGSWMQEVDDKKKLSSTKKPTEAEKAKVVPKKELKSKKDDDKVL